MWPCLTLWIIDCSISRVGFKTVKGRNSVVTLILGMFTQMFTHYTYCILLPGSSPSPMHFSLKKSIIVFDRHHLISSCAQTVYFIRCNFTILQIPPFFQEGTKKGKPVILKQFFHTAGRIKPATFLQGSCKWLFQETTALGAHFKMVIFSGKTAWRERVNLIFPANKTGSSKSPKRTRAFCNWFLRKGRHL